MEVERGGWRETNEESLFKVHGRKKTICVRKESALDILKRAEALRDSRGLKSKTWVERHRHVKKKVSIQGQWNPFFVFGGEPQSLHPLPPALDKYPRPKYGVAKRKTESMAPRFEKVTNFKVLSTNKRHARDSHFAGARSPPTPSL